MRGALAGVEQIAIGGERRRRWRQQMRSRVDLRLAQRARLHVVFGVREATRCSMRAISSSARP